MLALAAPGIFLDLAYDQPVRAQCRCMWLIVKMCSLLLEKFVCVGADMSRVCVSHITVVVMAMSHF